jgi:hypothetical protein
MTNPDAADAAKRLAFLQPKIPVDIQGRLNRHWDPILKLQNDDNYNQLKEMSPIDLSKTDLSKWQLAPWQRDKIRNLQNAYRKDPNGDPRVKEAYAILQHTRRDQLQALGVLEPPKPGVDATP